jgi:hypothetical protein
MKIKEMYEGNDLDFDMSVGDDDDYGGSETNFKQEAVQVQLMKVVDSEDHPDIKNPVRTVMTDDGKTVRVEHGEAKAMLKLLSLPNLKPDAKMQIMKDIQNSEGLEKMIAFVKKHGMVK